MTLNDWASVLAKAGKRAPDHVPLGWETIDEIVAGTRRSKSHTAKLLREAVKIGIAEVQDFCIEKRTKLYPTPHYRIIGKYENYPCREKTQK